MDKLLFAQITSFLDNLGEFVLVVHEGQIVYQNATATTHFGRMLSGSLLSFIGPRQARRLTDALGMGDHVSVEDFMLEERKYTVKANRAEGLLILTLDLGQTAQEGLFSQDTQDMLSMVGHEFRMPLNMIFSAMSLFIRRADLAKDDKIRRYLSIINQNCHKLLRLSNNIIDMGRYAAGQFVYQPETGDLVIFCRKVISSLAEVAHSQDIPIIFRCRMNSLEAEFDPGKLERLMLNILSNAFKYTREGNEIILTLSLRGEDEIVLEFSDRGIGIAPEMLPHVFDKYVRGEDQTIPGFGLGLSLVKAISELHGGQVAVRSDFGLGTTLTFVMPRRTMLTAEVQNVPFDYAGGFSHMLLEMSDALPSRYYDYEALQEPKRRR